MGYTCTNLVTAATRVADLFDLHGGANAATSHRPREVCACRTNSGGCVVALGLGLDAVQPLLALQPRLQPDTTTAVVASDSPGNQFDLHPGASDNGRCRLSASLLDEPRWRAARRPT
jgi:hypothetical protein